MLTMRSAMKWFWVALPAALLCDLVQAAEHGVPPLAIWQLPAAAPVAGVDVAVRKGWQLVEPDVPPKGSLAGGVALKNHSLLAVVRTGSQEIVLVSKGKPGGADVQHRLTLVATDDRPAVKLGAVELVEADESAAVVRFTAGQAKPRRGCGWRSASRWSR